LLYQLATASVIWERTVPLRAGCPQFVRKATKKPTKKLSTALEELKDETLTGTLKRALSVTVIVTNLKCPSPGSPSAIRKKILVDNPARLYGF